jgi:hypothetical protein
MLWFQGMEEPRYSEYNLEQFEGRGACLDYIFWNKAELVEQLYSVHVKCMYLLNKHSTIPVLFFGKWW